MGLAATIRKALRGLRIIVTRSVLRPPRPAQRTVYIDLRQDYRMRTLARLLIALELGGYEGWVRAPIDQRLLWIAAILPWHRNARIAWRGPRAMRPSMVWRDFPVADDANKIDSKIVQIRYDYGPHGGRDGARVMPFTMHPQIYVQYHDHTRLREYRDQHRSIRMLFAGNYNQAGYDAPIIRDAYHLLSRYQIVNHLLSEKLAHLVTSPAELTALMGSEGHPECLILDPAGLRINQDGWLKLMSQADFFLCTPGVVGPLSHSAVEALAVGTIPIINYSDWFTPPLLHGRNCVTFDDFNSLTHAMQQVKAMPTDHIREMRAEAIRYYEDHLNPARFIEQLAGAPEPHLTMRVLDENLSTLTLA